MGDFFVDHRNDDHINIKELRSVEYAIRCFGQHHARGHTLRLQVDSTAVYYMSKKWKARQAHHLSIVLKIWKLCSKWDIKLLLQWLPSKENALPDKMSRLRRLPSEVMLHPSLFKELNYKMNLKPQVDLFASSSSTQLHTYVARFPDPHSTATNALTTSLTCWTVAWAHPPWAVIDEFLARLHHYPLLTVMMVVPFWESASWWGP